MDEMKKNEQVPAQTEESVEKIEQADEDLNDVSGGARAAVQYGIFPG